MLGQSEFQPNVILLTHTERLIDQTSEKRVKVDTLYVKQRGEKCENNQWYI